MEQKSFKVSAEVLQKNAMKASIRDLNAEFQRMGGKVIHKASKHGSVYLLSHPNDDYLEQFRIRLLKELGLLDEKEVPKELKGPVAQVPRYGETHHLRKGWNVRSEKEIKEGRFDDNVRIDPWRDQKAGQVPPQEDSQQGPQNEDRWRPGRSDRVMSEGRRPRPAGPRRGPPARRQAPPREGQDEDVDPGGEPHADDEDEGSRYRTFEERWGNVEDLISIVQEALENGAVDDGEIIKFAYNRELPEPTIKKLKKQLWDNRCRGQREKCPYKRKKFKFEDMMRAIYGGEPGIENMDSPLIQFKDLWVANIERMYGAFKDRDVEVTGKISSYKAVYRKGFEHLKILAYDLKVKEAGSDGPASDVRKIWIKIGLKEYLELTQGKTIRIEDIVRLNGKCVLDPYFHDYWVMEVVSLEIVRQGQGEAISVVA